MPLKTKLILAGVSFLAIIFIGSIATAVIERNKAIELQSEIDRRDCPGRERDEKKEARGGSSPKE